MDGRRRAGTLGLAYFADVDPIDHAQAQGLSIDDSAASFKTIVQGGAPMYLADPQRALQVMGARFRALPPGEPSEVLVRGDTVMRHYWRNPETTAAAIRAGWLCTGDVARSMRTGSSR
jgi:long-chain acyl-CoA synthetase